MGSVNQSVLLLKIRYMKEKKRGEIMEIAMMSFKLSIDKTNKSLEAEFIKRIQEHNMAPYYHEVCTYFGREMESEFYNTMKANNDKVIKEKKDAITDIKLNGSEDDVLDLLVSLV